MSKTSGTLHFLFPVHGDVMVGEADGVWVDGGLKITAVIEGGGAERLTVNGRPAHKGTDGSFSAEVLLDGRFNRLEAVNPDSRREAGHHRLRLPQSLPQIPLYGG